MTLFGKGDGGGGPLPEQIHRLTRMQDVAGLPRVKMQTPQQAFKVLKADMKEPLVWVGELYFELHRGTYTTQAAAKRGNRRGEDALREAEMWSVLAHSQADASFKYPHDELQRLWRLLLLCVLRAYIFIVFLSAPPLNAHLLFFFFFFFTGISFMMCCLDHRLVRCMRTALCITPTSSSPPRHSLVLQQRLLPQEALRSIRSPLHAQSC